MPPNEGAAEILDLLGQQRVRQILIATSQEPQSAKELSEVFGVAPSTIYRQTESMVEHNLLIERTQVKPDGSHHSIYDANIDHLGIDINDGHIDVTLHAREDAAQRFSRIWDDFRRE